MPSERVQRRIDSLLDRAEEASDDGDWDLVLELTAGVLKVDPDNTDAQAFKDMAEASLHQAGSTPQQGSSDGPAAIVEDSPTSFANDRYEVKSLLGEGGKKKVYLAHDSTLDRDVAFGLIKAEGLDVASRMRITREAQAMGRLGDHPNIMPIHDLGDENGQPYMVQPLMAGGDVEALIENADEGRLSLEDALRIASEICRGLEFAHARGIIHRDLKPGNVWLTDDGTPRIGDFGLAIATDRSRLTQENVMIGTVSYMPPEQAIGGMVTAQADLYSLGAMLYEMLTGRPPFLGDDDIAIIGQHINTPPVAPSWHNQLLPQTLDSLIMRLLAKDPAERPESATDVLQALEAIDPAEAAASRDDGQGSLDSMSGGVFVGRHREMDTLKAAFEETLGGHGKMAALVGEPGIGKTRTAQELATYASMRGGQVLWGRCYEGGGAPPYYPWIQAIRSYVVDRDPETVRRQMGSTASVIAEVVPDIKERLPEIQPPQRIDDPESARFRLFDSITTFLKTASSGQPIVLMLEDLQWSDKLSLMLLEFVARELSNSRLMIVGNYRDMELNRRHPLSVTLGELTREHLFDRVLLRGLQKHDVRRFIEVAAGIDPPNPLVEAVHKQTEGNPLCVTETVRLLIQEGDITSGTKSKGGTSSWEIRIPEGVREVIGRRLDMLSERCNEVLTTASVIGRQFRFGVLMNLTDDVSEDMLLDVLDEALNARIVEEIPSDVGLYQFSHALMQETLVGEQSAARRVRLHARIAKALESTYGADAEDHASELATHFTEAESILGVENAIQYSVIAAERAFDAHAYDDAETHFRQAHSLIQGRPEDEYTARTLHGLGRLLAMSNIAIQEGWDLITAAFDIYVAEGNNEKAVQVAGTPVGFAGLHGTVDLTSKALDLLEPNSLDAGYLLARQSIAFKDEFGDFERELQALSRAMEIAQQYGDKRLEGRVNIHYGQHYELVGERQKVIEYCKKAAELARESNDPRFEHGALWAVAKTHIEQWETAAASSPIARVSELMEGSRVLGWILEQDQIAWELACSTGDWAGANTISANELERNGVEEIFVARKIQIQAHTGNELSEEERIDGITNLNSEFKKFKRDHSTVAPLFAASLVTTGWIAARDSCAMNRVIEMLVPLQSTLNNAISQRVIDMTRSVHALATGDDDSLPVLYTDMSRFATWWDRWTGVAVDHVLGLLAARMEHHDQSAKHFEYMIGQSRGAGFTPTLALVSGDYADMLLQRDAPGDSEKATELQDEAIAIATELGMKPLLERVLAQREILKA